MDTQKILKGKRILIVDDEEDVLAQLVDLLELSKIDTASCFDKAKDLLESEDYDIAVLDIMGVRGYDLLEIAKKKGIPSLMLTAHALSQEALKKSAEKGASYYAPKEEMSKIAVFIADVLEAKEKKKNVWVKCFERLGGYYDRKFGGPGWRQKEREFWQRVLKQKSGL